MRHRTLRFVVRREAQRKIFIRIAAHQNPRALLADSDQPLWPPMRAVDSIEQPEKIGAGNCFLVLLENAPARLRTEDTDVPLRARGPDGAGDQAKGHPRNGAP